MRWRVEHPLEVTVEEAFAAAMDPSTLTRVPAYMPMVRSAVRVSQRAPDTHTTVVVDRFEPALDPPAFARGVTREMLGWDMTLTWDNATHAATFVIDPHVKDEWKRYAVVRGAYRLERRGGGCARVIEGELEIKVPLLGAVAERFAVKTLSEQFAGEARLLQASAKARRGDRA